MSKYHVYSPSHEIAYEGDDAIDAMLAFANLMIAAKGEMLQTSETVDPPGGIPVVHAHAHRGGQLVPVAIMVGVDYDLWIEKGPPSHGVN
jgi:hypothetical protein